MKKTFSLLLPLAVVASLAASSTHALAQTGNVGIGTTNPQSKLHTTGGVRHDTLAGAGTRPVFADAQGRLSVQTPIPNTNLTPTPTIPDAGCSSGNGVSSSINVSGQPAAVPSAAIKVRINVTHTFDGDVSVYLLSPTGDTLRLVSNTGGSGDNFTNTIFWDSAAASISSGIAPFAGTYRPLGSLSPQCGITPDVATFGAMGSGGTINPNGTWRVLLFDATGTDVGMLNNWNITFDGIDPVVPTPGAFAVNVIPKSNGAGLVSSVVYDVEGKVGIGTANPLSQLHTTGGVQHDTLAGQGSRLVYADALGRLSTYPSLPNSNFAQTAVTPANGCATGNGVSSSIAITGQPAAVSSANIKVRVDITHTYDGDVRLYLLSPTGDTLRLLNSSGGVGDNFTNTIFWDGAATTVPFNGAPYTGTYKPIGGTVAQCGITPDVTTFGAMGGGTINPNGTWRLLLFDVTTQDVGRLNNWGITFDGTDPGLPTLVANAIPKSNGGGLVNSKISEVGGNVGIDQPAPAYKLDVLGGIRAYGNMRMTGADDTLSSWNSLTLRANDDNSGMQHMAFAVGSAERMRITPDGNVGIGTTTPTAPLQLGNSAANRKVVLYDAFDNDHQFYGFGINGNALRYQTDASNSDHVFYAATSATTSSELMRVKGTGDVTVAGTVTANGVKLPTTGGTPSTLNYYEEATLIVNFTNGPSTYLSNQNIKALRVGSQVTLTLPADLLAMTVNGVADIVMGSIPARFRPATNLHIPVRLQSGGAVELGTAWVRTDGTVWFRRPSQANYGGAGSGIFATSITYSVQ